MQHEFRRYWTAICHLGTNMRLLLAGAALLGLGNGIFLTFFNLYLKQGGLGEAFLGRLNSLGTIGSLALAIPAGLLVTRLGSRTSLVLSCALVAVFGALQAGVLVPALLIVLQIGVSASNMLYGATYNPEMMRSTDPGDRQVAFSLAFTIGTITSVVASVVGGLLPRLFARFGASSVTGLRLTLLIGAGFILASTVVFARLREDQRGSREPAGDTSPPVQSELEVTSSWRRFAIRYAVVNVIIGFGAGLSIPYLNLYFADRFHASTVAVGNLFAMSNVVLTVGVLLAPWLVRKAGVLRTIGVTTGGSLVFLVIMAFTRNIIIAALAFWLRAGLMMCSTPVTDKFCLELVPPEKRSVAHNIFVMAWTASWAVSTALGGWLIQKTGFALPMILTAAVYGTYLAVFILFFRHHPAMQYSGAVCPAVVPVRTD
ncbi:MAG: MFS transporter [Candidatus Cryosericum sp.]